MIPTTTAEMLDLPRAERSRYLAAIPLTRCFVFGCLETNGVRFIRRLLVRHGAVFREAYRYPGVYWVATFRRASDARAFCAVLADHMNKSLCADGYEPDEEDLYTAESYNQPCADVPALQFVKDVWITDERRLGLMPRPLGRA